VSAMIPAAPSSPLAQSRYTAKEPYISTKEPYISTIEPYISAKEPCISAKEPCISAKEPCIYMYKCIHIYINTHIRKHITEMSSSGIWKLV